MKRPRALIVLCGALLSCGVARAVEGPAAPVARLSRGQWVEWQVTAASPESGVPVPMRLLALMRAKTDEEKAAEARATEAGEAESSPAGSGPQDGPVVARCRLTVVAVRGDKADFRLHLMVESTHGRGKVLPSEKDGPELDRQDLLEPVCVDCSDLTVKDFGLSAGRTAGAPRARTAPGQLVIGEKTYPARVSRWQLLSGPRNVDVERTDIAALPFGPARLHMDGFEMLAVGFGQGQAPDFPMTQKSLPEPGADKGEAGEDGP